jgi:hypothetical protein
MTAQRALYVCFLIIIKTATMQDDNNLSNVQIFNEL